MICFCLTKFKVLLLNATKLEILIFGSNYNCVDSELNIRDQLNKPNEPRVLVSRSAMTTKITLPYNQIENNNEEQQQQL